jgi:hypothetical protein
MENVFQYFIAIGSGLTTGVIIVLLPSYWLFNKFKNKGKSNHAKY